MPSWAIHLAVTTKISNELNIRVAEKNILLIGNLLPDILNGYIIKSISHKVSHTETHMQKEQIIGNHKEKRYDIEGFYKKYNEKFNNPLILGYYMHILTDFYWNNLTYGKKGIKNDEEYVIGLKLNDGNQLIAPKEELRKVKANDFKIFSKYIYINKLADVPYYDEHMLQYAKEVTWLDLKKEDIIETVKYLEEMATFKREINTEGTEYTVFSKEEMIENLEKCVEMLKEKFSTKILQEYI